MKIEEQILVNILALDKGFEEFEFIHSYLGDPAYKKQAAGISVAGGYEQLKTILKCGLNEIEDEYPYFRRTYIRDLVISVLSQADVFVFKNDPGSFQPFVERLQGFTTLPPYDLDLELSRVGTDVMQLARVIRWCREGGVAWSDVLSGYCAETGSSLSEDDYAFMLATNLLHSLIRISWGAEEGDSVAAYLPAMKVEAKRFEGRFDVKSVFGTWA